MVLTLVGLLYYPGSSLPSASCLSFYAQRLLELRNTYQLKAFLARPLMLQRQAYYRYFGLACLFHTVRESSTTSIISHIGWEVKISFAIHPVAKPVGYGAGLLTIERVKRLPLPRSWWHKRKDCCLLLSLRQQHHYNLEFAIIRNFLFLGCRQCKVK